MLSLCTRCAVLALAALGSGNAGSGQGQPPYPGFVGCEPSLPPLSLVEITLVYEGKRRPSFGALVDEGGVLLFTTPRTTGAVSAYAKPLGGLSKRLIFRPKPEGVWLGKVEFALGDSDENDRIDQGDLDFAIKLKGTNSRSPEWYTWGETTNRMSWLADTNGDEKIDDRDIAHIRKNLGAASVLPPSRPSAVERLLSGKPLTGGRH